jgi:dihydroorotate dehydrogenase
MADVADYLTVNISSPNTPGLRDLQGKAALDELLGAVREARGTNGPPVFLKVAPDLEPGDIDDIARAALDHRLDALIVSNTTITRPTLESRHAAEAGGLSGAPLKTLALQRLRDFRRATGAAIPLIGVGGIESGPDAYARIRAGASLVQLYSALVFQGPGLVRAMLEEMRECMEADGFATIGEAVGTE